MTGAARASTARQDGKGGEGNEDADEDIEEQKSGEEGIEDDDGDGADESQDGMGVSDRDSDEALTAEERFHKTNAIIQDSRMGSLLKLAESSRRGRAAGKQKPPKNGKGAKAKKGTKARKKSSKPATPIKASAGTDAVVDRRRQRGSSAADDSVDEFPKRPQRGRPKGLTRERQIKELKDLDTLVQEASALLKTINETSTRIWNAAALKNCTGSLKKKSDDTNVIEALTYSCTDDDNAVGAIDDAEISAEQVGLELASGGRKPGCRDAVFARQRLGLTIILQLQTTFVHVALPRMQN